MSRARGIIFLVDLSIRNGGSQIPDKWLKGSRNIQKELSSYPSGDLLNRFNNDVGTIVSNAINWIPNLIVNIYMFVITFIVLVRMDIGMAAIAFLSASFLLAMSRAIMRKQKMYRKRVLELNSGMMSFEAETFFNFEMIKSFGILGHYSKRLKGWQNKYKDYNLD